MKDFLRYQGSWTERVRDPLDYLQLNITLERAPDPSWLTGSSLWKASEPLSRWEGKMSKNCALLIFPPWNSSSTGRSWNYTLHFSLPWARAIFYILFQEFHSQNCWWPIRTRLITSPWKTLKELPTRQCCSNASSELLRVVTINKRESLHARYSQYSNHPLSSHPFHRCKIWGWALRSHRRKWWRQHLHQVIWPQPWALSSLELPLLVAQESQFTPWGKAEVGYWKQEI